MGSVSIGEHYALKQGKTRRLNILRLERPTYPRILMNFLE